MDLSVIIVNYNTFNLTQDAINSIFRSTLKHTYEIYVVDNNSKDSDKYRLKKEYQDNPLIHLIFNDDNLGFSKANNIAMKECSGNYILLLNSDTIVKEDCIDSCLDYISAQDNIGALGCKLLLGDGTLDHACKRGFPTPSASVFYFLKFDKLFNTSKKFGAYTMAYLDDNSVGEVDALTGAFMLLPRTVIDNVGMLDEEFFMYGEDIDWCFRIKEAGYKIIYYPKAITIHLKGQSSKQKRGKTIYEFHRAMRLFYSKHYKSHYSFIVTWFLYLVIFLRMVMAYVFNFFKKR
jgi:GT2 family glycosyltransferase